MAVPYEAVAETRDSDIHRLALAQSYYEMSQTAAWKDLQERIDALVLKAQQDHFSSREVEPLKIVEEKLRWQQRLLMQKAVEEIVATHLKNREDILEEMRQANEYNPDNAE